MTNSTTVTFKVEQNKKYQDFRVNKYLNGEWINQRDGNWSKCQAEQKATEYRERTAKGFTTMTDNI
jgi:hypothetical protein